MSQPERQKTMIRVDKQTKHALNLLCAELQLRFDRGSVSHTEAIWYLLENQTPDIAERVVKFLGQHEADEESA